MKNKNEIFITGSTGIAGGFAVEELNHRGYPLRILIRNISSENKAHLGHYVLGDLIQLDNLNEISRDNAGIVHYACASLRDRADPQIDIDAMKVLLKNWEQGPFVFISSIDVYGSPKTTEVVDESHPLKHLSAYAMGKIACEELLLQAAKERGRNDFTILRAPWIYAPNLASKNHITSRFLSCFENEIILPGKTQAEWGKYIDCWVDARDLAWLVAESLKNPLGGAGNVIGGHYIWHDFFDTLKSIAKVNNPIVHKDIHEVEEYPASLFGQMTSFSGDKVNQHFKFKPKYNLQTTLQEAFKNN